MSALVSTGAEEQIINESLVNVWMSASDACLGGHANKGWGGGVCGFTFFITTSVVIQKSVLMIRKVNLVENLGGD